MDCDVYPENPLGGAFVVHDIQRKDWWPYRPIDGVVDALWLLGRDATPEGAFGALMAEWGEALDWFIAGTSRHQPGVEPPSWITQYSISTVKHLGQLTCEDGSPDTWHVEWWQIAPEVPALHRLLQGPLLQPRSGWWLAASPDTNAGWRFVKATTGLLWWTVKAHLPYRDAETADDSVIEALLGLLPQIGLMSVVPLNNHLVSGVVVFGTPEAIQGRRRRWVESGRVRARRSSCFSTAQVGSPPCSAECMNVKTGAGGDSPERHHEL